MIPGNLTGASAIPNPMVDGNVTSFDREYLHWSLIIVEVAAVVVIVVGDISMLMMFFTRKLLGQATNILVFSVAIGDLLTGLLAIPLAILQKVLLEPSDFLCKGYFYFANVSKTAVAYTILLLAMERIVTVISHTFRILPPGRCLFFASLTWFFAGAYNIWSVIIYAVEVVTLKSEGQGHDRHMFLCFASKRFMYLHDIFEVLNCLVTFTFPVMCSSALFAFFVMKRKEVDKPGRPYKSSKSVVIFNFALLVSFVLSHFPWEVATLTLPFSDQNQNKNQLVTLKIMHLISFTRGFWDIFVFGAFRHYVCKKEKALAHFREQRSLQVHRSSLHIPVCDRALSTSLLDSDPSVSRRYSSDISRRPSAMEDSRSMLDVTSEHHIPGLPGGGLGITSEEEEPLTGTDKRQNPSDIMYEEVVVITQGYLIPRSPCVSSENIRLFTFPPRGGSLYNKRTQNGFRALENAGSYEEICTTSGASNGHLDKPANPMSFRRKSCGDRAHYSGLPLKHNITTKHILETTAEVSEQRLDNEAITPVCTQINSSINSPQPKKAAGTLTLDLSSLEETKPLPSPSRATSKPASSSQKQRNSQHQKSQLSLLSPTNTFTTRSPSSNSLTVPGSPRRPSHSSLLSPDWTAHQAPNTPWSHPPTSQHPTHGPSPSSLQATHSPKPSPKIPKTLNLKCTTAQIKNKSTDVQHQTTTDTPSPNTLRVPPLRSPKVKEKHNPGK